MIKKKKDRLEGLLPPDESLTDDQIERILDTASYTGRLALLAAGGAVLTGAAVEVWRRYKPTDPFEDD